MASNDAQVKVRYRGVTSATGCASCGQRAGVQRMNKTIIFPNGSTLFFTFGETKTVSADKANYLLSLGNLFEKMN